MVAAMRPHVCTRSPIAATARHGAAAARRAVAAFALAALLVACAKGGATKPKQREPSPERDRSCVDPARPKAYFYPAENRTDYGPENPFKDGCEVLVPDHLFCCPAPGGGAGSQPR